MPLSHEYKLRSAQTKKEERGSGAGASGTVPVSGLGEAPETTQGLGIGESSGTNPGVEEEKRERNIPVGHGSEAPPFSGITSVPVDVLPRVETVEQDVRALGGELNRLSQDLEGECSLRRSMMTLLTTQT